MKDKSVFIPSTTLTFLENVIDSERMIVYLPDEKQTRILNECKFLASKQKLPLVKSLRSLGF